MAKRKRPRHDLPALAAPSPGSRRLPLNEPDEVMEKKPGLARTSSWTKPPNSGISDPRLIPSFLEEGTRIALHNEQLSVVRQLFAKAREAEEVHGLPIDEKHHRRVFREFSSLGASAPLS